MFLYLLYSSVTKAVAILLLDSLEELLSSLVIHGRIRQDQTSKVQLCYFTVHLVIPVKLDKHVHSLFNNYGRAKEATHYLHINNFFLLT